MSDFRLRSGGLSTTQRGATRTGAGASADPGERSDNPCGGRLGKVSGNARLLRLGESDAASSRFHQATEPPGAEGVQAAAEFFQAHKGRAGEVCRSIRTPLPKGGLPASRSSESLLGLHLIAGQSQ